jgi:hypothetical protein
LRSGYFCRAFSASARVFSGFDSGVNCPSMYSKRNHCSTILAMNFYSTLFWISLKLITPARKQFRRPNLTTIGEVQAA